MQNVDCGVQNDSMREITYARDDDISGSLTDKGPFWISTLTELT